MRIWLISENVKIVPVQLLRKCGFGLVFASVLRNVPYLRLFRSHCSIGDTSRTLQNTAHKTVYRLAVAGDRLCMSDNDHLSYPLRLLSFGMQMEYNGSHAKSGTGYAKSGTLVCARSAQNAS